MKYTNRELYLMGITDVLDYVCSFNRRALSQAKAEGKNSFYIVKEEISENYRNAYDLERALACDKWSELYKEIHGSKPKCDFNNWSLQDFEDDIIALSSEAQFVSRHFRSNSQLLCLSFGDFGRNSQKMILSTNF